MSKVLNNPIIGCVEMTVDRFIVTEDSKANRIGENRIGKTHLKSLTHGPQMKVAIGRYPDGREVIIDGHSRKAAWKAGTMDRPDKLFVDIYQLSEFKDEGSLIDIYCGRSSVSTPKEKAEQARNRNGLVFKSILCNSSWTAAMKAAGYKEVEGYERFKDALYWLDEFDLDVKNTKREFSAGIRAAFLDTFVEYRQQAMTFWADYIKAESDLPGALALKEALSKQEGWGGGTSAQFKRMATDFVKGG